MYGPMWIGITYACILSFVANLARSFVMKEAFVFEAEYVVKAFTVTAIFGVVVPLLVGFIIKLMDGTIPILGVRVA